MPHYMILLCVLLLNIGYTDVYAQSVADDETCTDPVRIATWNIENFTVSRAEDPETLATIVEVWTALDADIVALQEIGAVQSMDILLEAIESANGRHYDFVLVERGRQRVGFAWDTATVELINEPVQIDEVALANLRPAFTADFAFGAYDFTLVTLHLKATQEDPSRRIRAAQSLLLRRWHEARPESADPDVIFLGDFNDFTDSEGLAELVDFLYFTTDELSDESYSYIGEGFEGLIDHIAVTTGQGAEDEFCSVRLFDYTALGLDAEQFEAFASDHVPVIGEFSTVPNQNSEDDS